MSKNMHVENGIPIGKASSSVGTRGDSATARNKSGNHQGNRARSNRKPKNQH